MSKAKLGSFDDLMEITAQSMRSTARRLREIILEVDPEAVEVVRLGDRAATYGVGPKKMIEGYAYILPHGNWVNLGFYQGALLADPKELMEGTGAKMRHVKVRAVQDAEQPALRRLVKVALAERRKALER